MLEETLQRFDVNYQVIGGTKFYDRVEIKDAFSAYLGFLVNPADLVAFGRIVNSPRRGIGANTNQVRFTRRRQHRRADDLGGDQTGRGGAGDERRGLIKSVGCSF